jgi:hypothetical protein
VRLVVEANVEKEFVCSQAERGRFCAQYILEAYNFGKSFNIIANVKLKKPTELTGTDSGVEIAFNIQNSCIF